MYCTNCGANVPNCVRFCTNCGTKIEQPKANADFTSVKDPAFNITTATENPYSAAFSASDTEAQSFTQPYSQNYAQPQAQNYNAPQAHQAPQAPSYPAYQPSQNFPNTPPQYMRPVQTPNGVQYVAVDPVVHAPKPEPKHNPFTFISAGIAGLMFVLCFLPWFTVDNSGFNLFRIFSDNIYLELFEMDAAAACSFIMIVAMGLLIPHIILAFLRKNRLPIGFAIATSAITLFTLFLFVVLIADSTGNVEATVVPVTMFVLSVLNIVFPVVARKF